MAKRVKFQDKFVRLGNSMWLLSGGHDSRESALSAAKAAAKQFGLTLFDFDYVQDEVLEENAEDERPARVIEGWAVKYFGDIPEDVCAHPKDRRFRWIENNGNRRIVWIACCDCGSELERE